jgi:L-lactate dehydrogenase complex protein LldF
MVDTFHKHIRSSLADENLQIALDANAEKRINARIQAMASLPEDWEVMRQQAHAIRLHTIENLDRYLDEFTNHASSNGMILHKADNASRAVEIVSEIAKEKKAKLISKSKTMVSEEIGLNHALEAEGYEVVETDLGEFIIQLRGESPAHIITPAVHLRKEQVGETFKERLGIPYTADIPTMTDAARERLRQSFFNADIGLSGVNFGVAESGTICLVTNEGNGRMVTTLPPVHIALMGIERLVPTMADLSLMLNLLPRSATGQKITVYTNLINRPRQKKDSDGPQERHLILVDNGRRAMRNSPLAEALLCIRCGACLNACPVFAEIGGHAYVNDQGVSSTYPGPIGSIVSPGLFGQKEFGHLARASSLCGACKEACPVDIDLPKLLLRVRAGGVTPNEPQAERKIPSQVSASLKIYTWIASKPGRFSAALKLAGYLSRIVAPKSKWIRLPAFTGWGYSKDLPRPTKRPFRDRWGHGLESEQQVSSRQTKTWENDDPIPETRLEERADRENLILKFSQELTALDGEFTLCKSRDLSRLIANELATLGISTILAWDKTSLPPGLIEDLDGKGIVISDELDSEVKVGITGSEAGIADTGTLVLPSGKGKPQFVSLTPEIHIAILNAKDIYRDLSQGLQLPVITESSTISLISGPSRTADIEMTLTLGVHGPRKVHVFCLKGE